MKTELIRGLKNLKKKHQNCVTTIGNFDGVHIGHQAVLKKLKEKSAQLKLPSVVITFEPQPFEFFAKEQAAPRLTRCREKFCLLTQAQVDYVLVIKFNQEFAEWSAEQFIKELLINKLKIQYLIVGDDFRFGAQRLGDFNLLKMFGHEFDFVVESLPTVQLESVRVSSTRVRKALADADHALAANLLGRPYTMMGKVGHGDRRGRVLGFPTANIFLQRKVSPVLGVYAVKMHGLDENPLPGVANIGVRPTFGGTRTLLEVHLFDFDRSIYGQQVTVEFCKKLREEIRFDNFELLKEQMFKDAEEAKEFFEK